MLIASMASSLADGLTIGALPDGRLQLFVAAGGQITSSWKETPNPNSGWTPLSAFRPTPAPVNDVTVGRLPDGRLQLFASTTQGLYTCWKETTDPNANWTQWSKF
jgi:hypothetical protein